MDIENGLIQNLKTCENRLQFWILLENMTEKVSHVNILPKLISWKLNP